MFVHFTNNATFSTALFLPLLQTTVPEGEVPLLCSLCMVIHNEGQDGSKRAMGAQECGWKIDFLFQLGFYSNSELLNVDALSLKGDSMVSLAWDSEVKKYITHKVVGLI